MVEAISSTSASAADRPASRRRLRGPLADRRGCLLDELVKEAARFHPQLGVDQAGQIALTSTPVPAKRSAKRRESESWAALATEYSPI